MEDWTADPRRPAVFCHDRVVAAHVLVLLVGFRRGSVPPGHVLSITQLEYRAACEQGIDVLCFLFDDSERSQWRSEWDDTDRDPELSAWRNELKLKHGVSTVRGGPNNVAAAVSEALSRWMQERTGAANLVPAPAPLPRPRTTFFGREDDLRGLAECIRGEDGGVVTLLAPGGYGKTRLAIEVARRLEGELPGGAVFADLTEAESTEEVAHAVGAALGTPLNQSRDPVGSVGRHLQARGESLCVLDNFENLVETAGETIEGWMDSASECRFLVTSRIALNVYGERIVRLGPLADPFEGRAEADGDWERHPSIQLFADRVRRGNARFRITAENLPDVMTICDAVEHQPLLIEMAASRARTMALRQIAGELAGSRRLEFLGSRHSALYGREASTALATVEWSFQHLPPAVRNEFLGLCVFHGGFDAEAAQAVLGQAGADTLETIDHLVNHSFLIFDEPTGRYSPYCQLFIEFGRTASADRRFDADMAAVKARWSRHFIERAVSWNSRLHSGECRTAIRKLEADRENLLAAHRTAVDRRDATVAVAAMLAATPLLQIHGPHRLRLNRLLETLPLTDGLDVEKRCHVLGELSQAHWSLGEWQSAFDRAGEALQVAQATGDPRLVALGNYWCGLQSDVEGALRHFGRAIALLHDISGEASVEDRRLAALCKMNLALQLDFRGFFDQAFGYLAEAERELRIMGSPIDIAYLQNRRGLTHWHSGDPREAVRCFQEAERIQVELGNTLRTAGAITNRGLALLDTGDAAAALHCFQIAEEIHAQSGNRAWAGTNQGGKGLARIQLSQVEAGMRDLVEAEKTALEIPSLGDLAMHTGFRGRALVGLARWSDACEVLARSIAVSREQGYTSSLRFFSDLVHFAHAAVRARCDDDVRNVVNEARTLAVRFGLGDTHEVPWLNDSLRLLRDLETAQVALGAPDANP